MIEVLRKEHYNTAFGNKVIVLGGGNTAMDAAQNLQGWVLQAVNLFTAAKRRRWALMILNTSLQRKSV